jgi:transcriptional regulator with XRE-family HTH domain
LKPRSRTFHKDLLDTGKQMRHPRAMNSRREQREAFRQALRRAREACGLSQRAVGEAVGRTGSAVWQWEEGRGAPDQAAVIKLEAVLGLESGVLAKLLGYVPTGTNGPVSVVEALNADPRLDDSGRELLTSVYRWLVRQGAGEMGKS